MKTFMTASTSRSLLHKSFRFYIFTWKHDSLKGTIILHIFLSQLLDWFNDMTFKWHRCENTVIFHISCKSSLSYLQFVHEQDWFDAHRSALKEVGMTDPLTNHKMIKDRLSPTSITDYYMKYSAEKMQKMLYPRSVLHP